MYLMAGSNFGRAWTVGEELFVKKHYGTMCINEMSELINRSASSIKRRAYDLSVTPLDKKRTYVKTELKALLASWA